MKDRRTPAVVIAAHTMGLAVIRALGENGVPVVAISYDTKHFGRCSRYVLERIWAPHPERDEGPFLELLGRLVSRFGGSFLIPVSDEALGFVSRKKDLLRKSFVVAASDWAVTKMFIDKSETFALARACGVAVPRTVLPGSVEEADDFSRVVDYPCLVKPRQSHRYFACLGKKMSRAEDRAQLLAAYEEARSHGLEVMFQEFIPGDESQVVNYNSYFVGGEPRVEFTAQQIRKAPPVLGSPCVALSRRVPEVVEPARRILRAVGYEGFSCAEFKKDPRDGLYKLMEINARHNLSGLLAVRCGINFPWIHYRHLIEGVAPSPSGFREGVYWIDLERDIAQAAPNRRPRVPLARFFEPYLRRHVFAVFDRRDLVPSVRRWTGEVGGLLRSASRGRKTGRMADIPAEIPTKGPFT